MKLTHTDDVVWGPLLEAWTMDHVHIVADDGHVYAAFYFDVPVGLCRGKEVWTTVGLDDTSALQWLMILGRSPLSGLPGETCPLGTCNLRHTYTLWKANDRMDALLTLAKTRRLPRVSSRSKC